MKCTSQIMNPNKNLLNSRLENRLLINIKFCHHIQMALFIIQIKICRMCSVLHCWTWGELILCLNFTRFSPLKWMQTGFLAPIFFFFSFFFPQVFFYLKFWLKLLQTRWIVRSARLFISCCHQGVPHTSIAYLVLKPGIFTWENLSL